MEICGDDGELNGWLTDLKKGVGRATKAVAHTGLNLTRTYIRGVTGGGGGGGIPAEALQPAPASPDFSKYLPYALAGGALLVVVMLKRPSGSRR